jgi:V8-like Glu-specific endopeptidase
MQSLQRCLSAVMIIAVAACASSEGEIAPLRASAAAHHQLALERVELADGYGAILEWQAAIDALQIGSEPYYDGELYLDHSEYLANIAWTELDQGRVREAKTTYTSVIVNLQNAEASHRELLAQRDSTKNEIGLGLNLGMMFGLAAFGATGTPEQAQAAQNAIGMIGNAPLFPIDIDTTGEVVAYAGVEFLDEDAVRMPVHATLGPLASIAKLIGPSHSCTASLVGQALALTNSHCVVDEGNIDKGPFTLRFDRVGGFEEVPVVEVIRPDVVHVDKDWENDWALLRLAYHPAGRPFLQILDPDSADREIANHAPIAVGGYSGDLNDGRFMTLDWGCSFLDDSIATVLTYDCATFKGASGAPVLLTEGAHRYALIGVNAGGRGLTASESRAVGRAERHAIGSHVRNFYAAYQAASSR